MSDKRKIMALTAMAMCFSSSHSYSDDELATIKPLKPKPCPPIPKGCKLYLFDTNGTFTFERQPDKCYIEIVALNDKSAIKKFKAKTNENT